MRHRFCPKQRSNGDDGEKARQRRRLSVAHPCTEVAHGVHSPARGTVSDEPGRASFLRGAWVTCSWVRQDWLHAWGSLSSETCQNPLPRIFGGTHARRRLISLKTAIVLTQTHAAHASLAIAAHAAPPWHGGNSAAAPRCGRTSLSTVGDPVKQRLTRVKPA